jgi:purine-nucleoside phosphorylase
MVLGSGLGPIADEVQDATIIPYAEVPHFHAPAVQGHPGRLVIGRFNGVPALVLQGRFHYYEGHPMEEVILPIRVAKFLGCHTAILTNAAGGINHDFHLGDLMLITDHLNLMTANPLRGPNPPELGGPRFLDLSEPYDKTFVKVMQQQAAELGIGDSLRTGTYAAVSGPTYETPAETRMLRAIGADAVGMSTVPEVIAARHVGVRVVGVSCITNLACGISHDGAGVAKVTHEEVMENITLGVEKLKRLLVAAVPQMQQQHQTAAVAAAAGGKH